MRPRNDTDELASWLALGREFHGIKIFHNLGDSRGIKYRDLRSAFHSSRDTEVLEAKMVGKTSTTRCDQEYLSGRT